jgi:hypothetical protein
MTAALIASSIGFLQFGFFALAWGFVPAFIAKSKGRKDFWLWYVYGFFLLPVAVIHSIVLKADQTEMDERALPKPIPPTKALPQDPS